MARKVVSHAAKAAVQAPRFFVFRAGHKPGTGHKPLVACLTKDAAEAAQARFPFPTRVIGWSLP